MELFGILFGPIFWPAAIGAWVLFCRSRRIPKFFLSVGLVILVGLPLLGAFSLGHFMFLDEPLQIAAQKGDLKQAERSLKLGAFVNERSEMGSTPLMIAVREENIPMVELLLAHGADVEERDEEHHTILQMARHTHNKNLINLISANLTKSPGAKR